MTDQRIDPRALAAAEGDPHTAEAIEYAYAPTVAALKQAREALSAVALTHPGVPITDEEARKVEAAIAAIDALEGSS